MRLEWQILAAVALDVVLGDPQWWPHPVRIIGATAHRLEAPLRRLIRSERLAGVVAALAIVSAAGAAAWGLVALARLAHPWLADAVSIFLIYTTLAARDLTAHSLAVYRPLARGDLDQARRKVALIVGRDTANLDEAGVARAAVESVAESAVDGVTAPLFYAVVAGPVGAIVYRAINTLDSTFGYTTQRYLKFGWASARLDDLANYIPARLTAPLLCVAAALTGRRPVCAARILARDGRRHGSPNAGLTEAAMAGALGVQLGGLNYYGGEPHERPLIGEPRQPLSARHIVLADVLTLVTAGLFLTLALAARMAVHDWWIKTTCP